MGSIGRFLALALVCVGLAGCASGAGYFTPSASMDAAKLTPEAAKVVANDLVAKLSERLGSGTATIALNSDGTAFGAALEESMRRRGYAVTAGRDVPSGAIPIAYAISEFGAAIMVRLSSPTVELTRSYTISDSGVSPASPLSVMQRGEG